MFETTDPTAAPATPRTMTLIYTKDRYSHEIKAITLVDNKTVADSLAALIDQTDSKAELLEVPIWPNMRASEDK